MSAGGKRGVPHNGFRICMGMMGIHVNGSFFYQIFKSALRQPVIVSKGDVTPKLVNGNQTLAAGKGTTTGLSTN
jgi:hypothetical protein